MINEQYEPSEVALYVDGKLLKGLERFRFNSLNKGREIEIDVPILADDERIDYSKMNNVKLVQTFVKKYDSILVIDEDEGLYKREYYDVTFVGIKNTMTDLTSPAGVFDTYIFSCDSVSSILKIDERSYEKIIGQRITYTGSNLKEIIKLWPDLFESEILKNECDAHNNSYLLVDTRYVSNKLPNHIIDEDYNLEEKDEKYMVALPICTDIIRYPTRSKITIER